MALKLVGRDFYLSTLYQVWRFTVEAAQQDEAADHCFVPRVAHTTGDVDVHDFAVLTDGTLVFANTLYSCLATLSDTHSFKPVWWPKFISKLVPEDRCHLNGIAEHDGQITHVTAVSQSDIAHGWRARRHNGGCLIDVHSNAVVTNDLSMPHSPRWHRGALWLLNSGRGELGTIDPATGQFEARIFLPGFLRGLSFHGRYALVGLSKPRDGSFDGLALDEALRSRDADPRCGIHIVDLDRGCVVEWLEFEAGSITELFSVEALPDMASPIAVGLKSDEILNHITIAPP